MKTLAFLAAGLLAVQAPAAFANEEVVQHYAAEKVNNEKEAVALLNKDLKRTEELLKKEKLTDSDLETVHEYSYSLEASVTKLREHAAAEKMKTVDNLAEAVQALHYASENHKEAQVREWAAKLKPLVEDATKQF